MRTVLIAFGMVTLMSFGIAFAMVEMYRIEMDSYDARVIAFYGEYFDFIESQENQLNQANLCQVQVPDANSEVVM